MSLFMHKYDDGGGNKPLSRLAVDAGTQGILESQLLVRINGTISDFSTLGDEEKSERAAEVKKMNIAANTSCSIFNINPSYSPDPDHKNQIFHLLIDIGEGVMKSLEVGIPSVASKSSMVKLPDFPNAVLVTHPHEDHVKDLPYLLNKVNLEDKFNVYCTKECRDQIINRFPQLTESQAACFIPIKPGESFEVGPFYVTPLLAAHDENSPSACVIYVVKFDGKKMVFGWDFLFLPDADENILWNPDLLILGTQSYNPHPKETGMISVTDAYELVRRWNAKESYLVHYRGLMDFEESKNQWFRGPTKSMNTDELQKNVDSHLGISGDSGRFTITVAKEGMTWIPKDRPKHSEQGISIGNFIEVEGLQKYVFKIEKENKDDKLRLTIEDSINRYTLQFDRPRKDKNNDYIVRAEGEKGMLARGPDLTMELVMPDSKERESAAVIVRASKGEDIVSIGKGIVRMSKGKKFAFNDDILISPTDALRLRKYFEENFATRAK
jgi:phosphoribosyl 1,2-cyclic phosphodiesterase